MKYPNNWFDYALKDIRSGEILLKEAIFDMACFHSQQAAEKSLKGFLVYNEQSPTNKHNLNYLVELCSRINDNFNDLYTKIITLDQFYMPTRYPDAPIGSLPHGMPNRVETEEALGYAKEIFDFCIDSIERIDKKRIERSDR